jgi:CHAD domain-containing protein
LQDNKIAHIVKQNNPGVLPTDEMSEAGRKLLRFHFARMLQHEPGTRLGEDIEELHDMRVATRRMRSIFQIFGDFYHPRVTKTFRKNLISVGRALGRVRDLDVSLDKAYQYQNSTSETEFEGLAPLIVSWNDERQMARKNLLAFLDSNLYNDFKYDFEIFLQTPGLGAKKSKKTKINPTKVNEIAPVLILRCLSSVRAYDPIIREADFRQLHQLRMEFKTLRYTMEFFREVLEKSVNRLINEIKGVQDHLGDLNDADVTCQYLTAILANKNNLPGEIEIKAIQKYLDTRKADRTDLFISFPEVWDNFNQPRFRKKLLTALAIL